MPDNDIIPLWVFHCCRWSRGEHDLWSLWNSIRRSILQPNVPTVFREASVIVKIIITFGEGVMDSLVSRIVATIIRTELRVRAHRLREENSPVMFLKYLNIA